MVKKMDEAWNDVGQQFGALGEMFAKHFDEETTGDVDADPVATQLEIDAAVSKLKASLETAVAHAGNAAKDPALKDEARQSAASVLDAIGTTFNEVGEEISKHK